MTTSSPCPPRSSASSTALLEDPSVPHGLQGESHEGEHAPEETLGRKVNLRGEQRVDDINRGKVTDCLSACRRGVAISWTQRHFFQERTALLMRLRAL